MRLWLGEVRWGEIWGVTTKQQESLSNISRLEYWAFSVKWFTTSFSRTAEKAGGASKSIIKWYVPSMLTDFKYHILISHSNVKKIPQTYICYSYQFLRCGFEFQKVVNQVKDPFSSSSNTELNFFLLSNCPIYLYYLYKNDREISFFFTWIEVCLISFTPFRFFVLFYFKIDSQCLFFLFFHTITRSSVGCWFFSTSLSHSWLKKEQFFRPTFSTLPLRLIMFHA